MRSFWDDRAREDALYFVDNRLAYGDADADAFWSGGEEDLRKLLAAFGMNLQSADTVVDIGCGVGSAHPRGGRPGGRGRLARRLGEPRWAASQPCWAARRAVRRTRHGWGRHRDRGRP